MMRRLGVRSETSGESTVRSNLVGNAGSRPISEAKQPWACPVLGWGTTGEAHVLYSFSFKIYIMSGDSLRCARAPTGALAEKQPSVAAGRCERRRGLAVVLPQSGGFDSHPALRRKSDDPSQYHIWLSLLNIIFG